ncbi:hypothetical protein AGMMS50230_20430 [Spirochaetia bacterium]|nr:hypothetical protein AGMMS50230_20430 [Spirochaetia bacterium]
MRQINWDDLGACLEASSLEDSRICRKSALTIGVFDGIHRGHQALLSAITGKKPELIPVVVTFRENPKKQHFSGFSEKSGEKPDDICGFNEKMTLLEGFGVELCVIIDFSENFSTMSGRVFVETLNRYLHPEYIALGMNFHCGYRRDTDAQGFKALAENLGITADIIGPILEGGAPVSSSRVRAALKAGRFDEASLLLGREAARSV